MSSIAGSSGGQLDNSSHDSSVFWSVALECALCDIRCDVLSEPKLLGCLHTVCTACTLDNAAGKQCKFCSLPISPGKVKHNIFYLKHFIDHSEKVPLNAPITTASGVSALNIPEGARSSQIGLNIDTKPRGDQSTDASIVANGQDSSPPSAPSTTTSSCASCEEQSSCMQAYCPDCAGSVCGECVSIHSKIKQYRSHTLEAYSPAKEQAMVSLKRVIGCLDHLNQVLYFHCEDDNQMICVECAKDSKHSGHRLTKLSDDRCLLRGQLKSEATLWVNQLSYKCTEVSTQLRGLKDLSEQVATRQSTSTQLLNGFSAKFKKWIEASAQQVNEKVRKSAEEKNAIINEQKEISSRDLERLTHAQAFANQLVSQSFVIGLFKAKNYLNGCFQDQVNAPICEPSKIDVSSIGKIHSDARVLAELFVNFLKSEAGDDELFKMFKRHLEAHFANVAAVRAESEAQHQLQRTDSSSPGVIANNVLAVTPMPSVTSPTTTTLSPIANNITSNSVQVGQSDPRRQFVRNIPIPEMPSQEHPQISPRISSPRISSPRVPDSPMTNGSNDMNNSMYKQSTTSTISSSTPAIGLATSSTPTCCVCLDKAQPPIAKCSRCEKWFHELCHVPDVPSGVNWVCTFCVEVDATVLTELNKIICSRNLLLLACRISSLRKRLPLKVLALESDSGRDLPAVFAQVKDKLKMCAIGGVQFTKEISCLFESLKFNNKHNLAVIAELVKIEKAFNNQTRKDFSQPPPPMARLRTHFGDDSGNVQKKTRHN